MFISEQEANNRVNSSENVLQRIRRDEGFRDGEAHTFEPEAIPAPNVAELPAPTDEDFSCESAQVLGIDYPDEKVIKRMLGLSELGRGKGRVAIPNEVRAAAGVCAELTTAKTAARAFDMSVHHADELKHGFTNQLARYGGQAPQEDLKKEIDRQKKHVRDLAFEKLIKTLGLMSDDKLASVTDPTKLSRISKDLAVVVDKTTPKEEGPMGGVHFHVWRPEMRTEESYEVINVGGQR